MKVLITGAGGQVARALVAARPEGATVLALSRADLDISDRTAVLAAIGEHRPDLVFNAAAYTAVDKAESEPHAAMAVNGIGVGWLAEACTLHGAQLVHLSTDYVFSGESPRPYQVDDLPDPNSVYGQTKRAGELAALNAPEALVVRTAWVHSSGPGNFVATMLRLMAGAGPVRVVDDQIGSPTHAASLAGAVWSLARAGATGIHHATDAGAASWYDFAVAVREEALAIGLLTTAAPVVPIGTADYPTAAPRPSCALLDKSATWALLGAPARHWREELRDTLLECKAAAHG